MIVLHLLGVVARTGALGVGVHVPRLRTERLIRLAATSAALALAALGLPVAFVGAATVLAVWFFLEAGGAFRRVWEASATEFAWTALTADGFTSEVLTAPHPAERMHGGCGSESATTADGSARGVIGS
jgi:hypothetical protein